MNFFQVVLEDIKNHFKGFFKTAMIVIAVMIGLAILMFLCQIAGYAVIGLLFKVPMDMHESHVISWSNPMYGLVVMVGIAIVRAIIMMINGIIKYFKSVFARINSGV